MLFKSFDILAMLIDIGDEGDVLLYFVHCLERQMLWHVCVW